MQATNVATTATNVASYTNAAKVLRANPRVRPDVSAVETLRARVLRANPPGLIVSKTYVNDQGIAECALYRLDRQYSPATVRRLCRDLADSMGADDWTLHELDGVLYATLKEL